MTTLKTVEELAKSKTRALLHPGIGLLYVREEDVVELLTQDRASIHTSLVEAVEGLDYYGWDENNQRMIKEKTLTIINSIFKE